MSLRPVAAQAPNQDAKASRLGEVLALGYRMKTGASVDVNLNDDEDTRPPHMRNRFKIMKKAAADARMPKMPDLFSDVPLASGTYGFIFRSRCDSARVFKVSANHKPGMSCSRSFRHEYNVARFVTKCINSGIAEIEQYALFGTNPSQFATTDTFCFFAMDYITPIIGQKKLIELMPGDPSLDPSRVEGGVRNARPAMTDQGGWMQYGKRATKGLMNSGMIPGMTFELYCTAVGKFCATCNFMGIMLADVEFIVGTAGERTGVLVLDFDKVHAIAEERIYTEEYRSKLGELISSVWGRLALVLMRILSYSFSRRAGIHQAYADQMMFLLATSMESVKEWVDDGAK